MMYAAVHARRKLAREVLRKIIVPLIYTSIGILNFLGIFFLISFTFYEPGMEYNVLAARCILALTGAWAIPVGYTAVRLLWSEWKLGQ